MDVLVVASRKGGAGKTTLACHLAVEVEKRGGGPVAMIDADPMAGLTGWFEERKAETPICVDMEGLREAGLTHTLRTLEDAGIKVVVVDTAPASDGDVEQMIQVADLIIVPVIPSPNDLRAIGETLDLIEGFNKPAMFVINNAATNAKLTKEAVTILSQNGPIAAVGDQPVIIRTRTDFRSSMTDGRTVGEIKGASKSADEISDLWTAVQARLVREKRRGRRTATA